jgi:hypothetical protein
MVKSCFRTASGPRSQRENEGEIGENSIRRTENLSEHQESVGISCAYVAGYLLRARDRSPSAACIQPFWAKPQALLASRPSCENAFPMFENFGHTDFIPILDRFRAPRSVHEIANHISGKEKANKW